MLLWRVRCRFIAASKNQRIKKVLFVLEQMSLFVMVKIVLRHFVAHMWNTDATGTKSFLDGSTNALLP